MNTKALDQYHLHKEVPSARQFELFDLKAYLKKNLAHGSVPHSHSFYQLIWFESDQGFHHVDFVAHPISQDRVFLIAKNQVHFFDPTVDYKGILMHFNESFLLRNEMDMELFMRYGLFNSDVPFVQLDADLQLSLSTINKEIQRELSHRAEFGHRKILSQLLRTFLILLERHKRNESTTQKDPQQQSIFLKFRAALEAGYNTDQSVAEYAAILHVTSKTLSSYCKKETGRTASELITERKTLEAKRLLLHSNALVNEVGYSLGFEDPSYFAKFFKKQVGMTPLQFRKSISE